MNPTTDKVAEYLDRLAALHNAIRGWLRDSVIISEEPVDIWEEGADRYRANALVISDSSGALLATLRPIGTNIVGAEGQVRLVGTYDTRIITYVVDGGPTIDIEVRKNGELKDRYPRQIFPGLGEPDWYVIIDPRTGQTQHLDESLFKKLLTEVSDYGE